jgi:hypothetical protein
MPPCKVNLFLAYTVPVLKVETQVTLGLVIKDSDTGPI